jgi:hypothetical protein
MKTLSLYTVLVVLALKKATAALLPQPQLHLFQRTDIGPVYSNISPKQRRDFIRSTFNPADEYAPAIDSSDITPSTSKRSDAYTPAEASQIMALPAEEYVILRTMVESIYTLMMCLLAGAWRNGSTSAVIHLLLLSLAKS